jgi:hypothetical protein
VRSGPQPVVVGLAENPKPGKEGITTWKASDALALCAVGLISGSMIFSCSTTEPGHPCVTMSGNAFSCSNVARDGNKAELALKRLQDKWPPEFRDGVRCGFLQKRDGVRDSGGYPPGFNHWPLERRNAWFAGFNVGLHDRLRLSQNEAAL